MDLFVRNKANLRRSDGLLPQQLDNTRGRVKVVCGYIGGMRCVGRWDLSGERSLLRQIWKGGRIGMTHCGHLVAFAHE